MTNQGSGIFVVTYIYFLTKYCYASYLKFYLALIFCFCEIGYILLLIQKLKNKVRGKLACGKIASYVGVHSDH